MKKRDLALQLHSKHDSIRSIVHRCHVFQEIVDLSAPKQQNPKCRYAQCLPLDRVEEKISQGWDGRMLTCEEMPDDLDPQSSRRLLDMGVPGSYGDAPSSSDGPRTSSLVLGSGCDTCAPMFGQCGEHGDVVSCCGAGLQCTKKNKFFGTTYFLVTALLSICMGCKMIVSTDKKYMIFQAHTQL